MACLVLGAGLLGGAAAGSWLQDGPDAPTAEGDYELLREVWHSTEVDELFPRTLKGEDTGPGKADRVWTRIAIAPDSGCAEAFDPNLAKALAPVGCTRLLRATYADATTSSVTTVGILFAKAGPKQMRTLRERFTEEKLAERADLMPRPYAAKGTAAAGFGDKQRASWSIGVLPEAPVIIYSVSGFADGRMIADPVPADDAARPGRDDVVSQAGLGNDARGVAGRIEAALRPELAAAVKAAP